MIDAVMKLYRCVVEIEMTAKVKDGCGPSRALGVGDWGNKGGRGHSLRHPWLDLVSPDVL